MTKLEQAIATALRLLDYAHDSRMTGLGRDPEKYSSEFSISAETLRAVATGQLVPAQEWRPIETMPDCVNVLMWARGWGSPSIGFIGFTSDGVGPYDPISGGAFDPWPTHWMPLPPPPAEGV